MIEFDASSFIANAKSLFLHLEEENLAPYIYSTPDPSIENDPARGEEYYQILIEDKDYYLYKEEIRLINTVASQIAAYVPQGANIIEFGPGTKMAFVNKSLPFIKAVKQLKSYVPVDLCKTYLVNTEEVLKQELPEIAVKPLQDNFIENTDLVKIFERSVVWFKGSTITNLSTSDCIDFLTKISQALQPEGLLIVGVDANQNESSLKKAYSDKMADLTLSTLYWIDRDLPVTNFNPAAFKYQPEWVPENYCFQHNVVSTSEQEFVFDGANISIEEGEKFHLLSSYKYPVEYFQSLAKKAGLEPLDCFIDEGKRMVIHVLGVGK